MRAFESVPVPIPRKSINIPRLIIADIFDVAFKLLKHPIRLRVSLPSLPSLSLYKKRVALDLFSAFLSRESGALIIYPSVRFLFYPRCARIAPPHPPSFPLPSLRDFRRRSRVFAECRLVDDFSIFSFLFLIFLSTFAQTDIRLREKCDRGSR